MERLFKKVETKISMLLPNKFALILDSWTNYDTHYVAVYATYPSENSCSFTTLLLAFAPFENETSRSSSCHENLFQYVLNVYNRDLNNVCALIGDNCAVNLAVARKLGSVSLILLLIGTS